MRRVFRLLIAADNDSAGIEVIVERFRFPEKLRAEDDPIKLEARFEMFRMPTGTVDLMTITGGSSLSLAASNTCWMTASTAEQSKKLVLGS